MARRAGTVVAMLFLAHAAAGQFAQQGTKLVGTGAVGQSSQGFSAAISADGNTAIVGGPGDNTGSGAAWVFSRSGQAWAQQGTKLVATGAVVPSGYGIGQGYSVAISGDGNTAIVGGPYDNSMVGAAWVFTRSAGSWSRSVRKLVAVDAVGNAWQGSSVAISADGNTAVVGGPSDSCQLYSGCVGAAWVFTRSGNAWSQLGGKLVGTGAVGNAGQGSSVAISADGTTVIVGGPVDNTYTGAAWVFTRNGGVWLQQGSKLIGSGADYAASLGRSVAISADGNTAIVGGSGDPPNGAAWVFTRSGGVWLQQGNKLVGTGADNPATQGTSVGISANGDIAVVGGPMDYPDGATWVYTRSAGVWSQQGAKLVGMGVGQGYPPRQGSSVAISGDGTTVIVGAPEDGPYLGAAWVFLAGGCAIPFITAQPLDQGIASGQTATLWVTATGTAPFSYQWYQGNPGDTSHPFGSSASSFTTPVLTTNASYWVRVSNACGQADSAAATVWVGPTYLYSTWLPVVGEVGGLNDSLWQSDVGVLNTGSGTANVLAKSYGTGGIGPDSAQFVVEPYNQAILTGLATEVGVNGLGAIQLLSDQPLRITTRTYNHVSPEANCYPNGTQGQDYPAVVPNDGLAAGQSAYLAGLRENASYRSDIGLVNVGTGAATVLVELFDGAGTKLTDYTVALAVGQWTQETQPFKSKARVTAMDRGYARITVQSGAGVFGFASVVDNITNDPTTIAMQRASSLPFNPAAPYAYTAWIPVASRSSGLNLSQWRSDLGLLNLGAVTANLELEFFGSAGVTGGTTYVPAGAQSILTDVVGQLGGSGSGAIEVLSDQPLDVTARTYNQVALDASCDPGGTQGQDYPAVVPNDGLAAGQSAYLAGLRENASYRSNIGLVNVGADAATVLVELFDGAGTKLTDYTVALAVGQWAQETQPFKCKAQVSAMDYGYARITVQSGAGVFGFASVVDNITNDPTTVAMQK